MYCRGVHDSSEDTAHNEMEDLSKMHLTRGESADLLGVDYMWDKLSIIVVGASGDLAKKKVRAPCAVACGAHDVRLLVAGYCVQLVAVE